jgi:hypothetical protein
LNWDAVGAVAELVAAGGVIASLFYLGMQVRQNTRSVRASSYHAVVASLSQQSSAASHDPALVEVVFRGQSDFGSLSRVEQMQFMLFLGALFRGYEDVFYRYHQKMLDESVWSGWANSMTHLFWQPGGQRGERTAIRSSATSSRTRLRPPREDFSKSYAIQIARPSDEGLASSARARWSATQQYDVDLCGIAG